METSERYDRFIKRNETACCERMATGSTQTTRRRAASSANADSANHHHDSDMVRTRSEPIDLDDLADLDTKSSDSDQEHGSNDKRVRSFGRKRTPFRLRGPPPSASPAHSQKRRPTPVSLPSIARSLSVPAKSRANRRWRQLRWAAAAVERLKRPEIHVVNDLNDLVDEHPSGATQQSDYLQQAEPRMSTFQEALHHHRLQQRLFDAASKGHVGEWQQIYKNDPSRKVFDGTSRSSTINAHNQFGYTQLHVAAQNGDVAMCTCLLEHGADASILSKNSSEYPLETAAKWGHADVVSLLLQQAPASTTTNSNNTALLRRALHLASNDRVRSVLHNHAESRGIKSKVLVKRPQCCCVQ
ncbi:unnamed protein product [Vitrella brassicaformis CCMP3155]|uniref:Uncharacterized protein n=3 Tax=Vitrella brassicaformis TaxID=1169539 RepID=A0A0G4H5B9_VITBC|nr:unnamed protein product [Vitrella brassicaformis CCMP3155]|mmetsp:Transcript_40205/g.114629  ORF Transcript_40205/g.114629 Transcript_40205/m.114629 type:complete len:356 (+) Transcript_40205:204-1271(+)|eukprot:CEM38958.1 unnamed protein product [Vitrella brassicaformis CCMP3155]